ncbi:MAG: metallophosphoesterase [Streptomyces sp.]|jgi:UDP-2,3-diacylglucosamine pyrophosphatase LpxH|nr:metallophosphoesterase [Streptomyces sp.]
MSGPAADGVVREKLTDDTLVVFLSDTHIGGPPGSDIFESPAELGALLRDLSRHRGPVELVLAGDFFDLLRMRSPDRAEDVVTGTIARPEYQELFAELRAFAIPPGRRVVYVVGNHDAEVWWNTRIQRTLREAGLVDVFALSYSACFQSFPEQCIYCEHGNQFDPANTLADYANPLDTPVGAHVMSKLILPIESAPRVTAGFDVRDVRFVFPLAAHPGPAEWIGGRIFYRFLDRVLPSLLGLWALLMAAYLGYQVLQVALGHAGPGLGATWWVLLEAVYGLAVLLFALLVVFLISRRTAERTVATLAKRFTWLAPGLERDREAASIRQLLEEDRAPPMARTLLPRGIGVFISGHTHAPAISTLTRSDGTQTVIVNAGCWLRQLQPVEAWLGVPPVFVPAFVLSHVRVLPGHAGLAVELREHPKPAERRLPWIERMAIAGKMPPNPPPNAESRLMARQVVARPPVPLARGWR